MTTTVLLSHKSTHGGEERRQRSYVVIVARDEERTSTSFSICDCKEEALVSRSQITNKGNCFLDCKKGGLVSASCRDTSHTTPLTLNFTFVPRWIHFATPVILSTLMPRGVVRWVCCDMELSTYKNSKKKQTLHSRATLTFTRLPITLQRKKDFNCPLHRKSHRILNPYPQKHYVICLICDCMICVDTLIFYLPKYKNLEKGCHSRLSYIHKLFSLRGNSHSPFK